MSKRVLYLLLHFSINAIVTPQMIAMEGEEHHACMIPCLMANQLKKLPGILLKKGKVTKNNRVHKKVRIVVPTNFSDTHTNQISPLPPTPPSTPTRGTIKRNGGFDETDIEKALSHSKLAEEEMTFLEEHLVGLMSKIEIADSL